MPTVEFAILIELYFHQTALRWSAVPGSGSGDMRKQDLQQMGGSGDHYKHTVPWGYETL